jgi:hypothetical protein
MSAPGDFFTAPNIDVLVVVNVQEGSAAELTRTLESLDVKGVVVDTALVAGEFHIQACICKALLLESLGKMRTRELSSELYYHLSPSGNFSKCTTQFSPTSNSVELAVVLVGASQQQLSALKESVGHKRSVIGNLLEDATDTIAQRVMKSPQRLENVEKLFKLTEREIDTASLEDCVVSKIAAKDL